MPKSPVRDIQNAFFRWDTSVKAILENTRGSKGIPGYSVSDEDRDKLKRAAMDFAIRMRGIKNKKIEPTLTQIAKTVDPKETSSYKDLFHLWYNLREADFDEREIKLPDKIQELFDKVIDKVMARFRGNNS